MCSRSLAIRTEIYGARTSIVHPLAGTHQFPSINKPKKALLILLRHEKMSEKDHEDIIEAGNRFSNISVDVMFNSSLMASKSTAVIASLQREVKKAVVLLEGDTAIDRMLRELSRADPRLPAIAASELRANLRLPPITAPELRDKLKSKTGENLEWCIETTIPYFTANIPHFTKNIEPQLKEGKNVLVTAKENALRSIIMYLDNLTAKEVIDIEILTGIPMLYFYEDGKLVGRGSPI